VVSPNHEGHEGNRDARERDRFVAEDAALRVRGEDLGGDTHARQNHDVNGRMAVEPEEVLEQNWVTAQGRIEDADVEGSFEDQQHEGDAENWRRENLDDARGVERPEHEGHTVETHARCAKLVQRDDEVEPREDAREPHDEDAEGREDDGSRRNARGIGDVERPARVHAAAQDGREHESCADPEDVQAHEVELGEGHVFGADHDRQDEVTQRCGNRRNDEKKDHGRAMQRKRLVVLLRGHDGFTGG